MSTLSFVALELQTTHLNPASVSQVSYVKIVNENITRIDSWPVTPPTSGQVSEQGTSQDTRTWQDALAQLTMVVGQLPIVSYYRDADKEVFHAASTLIGETTPDLHWLDCRELARKFLPDLPEFQLSTVLKALDLFEEHGDSEAVEQTTQIVVELARLEGVTSVEQLWGDLYDQPDRILGLEPALHDTDFMDVPVVAPEISADIPHDSTSDTADVNAAQEVSTDHESIKDDSDLNEEPEVDAAEPDESSVVDDESAELGEIEAGEVADHFSSVDETVDGVDSTGSDEVVESQQRADQKESALINIGAASPTGDQLAGPEVDEHIAEPSEPPEPSSSIEPELDTQAEATAEAPPEYVDEASPEVPAPAAQAVEVPQRSETEDRSPGPSRALRIFAFLGTMAFGIVSVVGLVLTAVAVLLFFTDNDLLLEAKIAGVILMAAITLLGALMTTISYRGFRNT